MKITRIHRLRAYRIFRDFSWPNAGLPDFGRFNVIYGWNGSGKTSLSNLFRQIQKRESITEGEAEIVVDQGRVSGTNFNTATLPDVRVFNRDTVQRNVFDVPNQQFPPVFFLGEDSVIKQKRIEELKKKLSAAVDEQMKWERKKVAASGAVEAFSAEQAKAIKNLLAVAGGGPFNNYNAANFKSAVQRLAGSDPKPNELTDQKRDEYLASRESRSMDKVLELEMTFPDFPGLTQKTQQILQRSLISKVISVLSENPQIASWVSDGLGLHTGSNFSKTCHFCDQQLPESRIKTLENHFNDEFKRFQNEVDTLISEVERSLIIISKIDFPSKSALYSHLQAKYVVKTTALGNHVVLIGMYLNALNNALKAKKAEPFKVFELRSFLIGKKDSDDPSSKLEIIFQAVIAGGAQAANIIGESTFKEIKEILREHNKHTDNFAKAVSDARSELAQDEVLKSLVEWKAKSDAVTVAQNKFSEIQESASVLKSEIVHLETEVRQHRRPAVELNKEIASYLGRDELRFEVEQNGYRITRNGQSATHLSEGERTAIAFLYFLKSLNGTDFDIKTGIVVIDDPVSSLDTNSLFSAFGFMKQRTLEAGQLFVLTHNFTFFRQVRNWYYNMKGQKSDNIAKHPARFYMLSPTQENGLRSATLEALDPFLHQYESEYHYLFKRVYEEGQRPLGRGLETHYGIPNIARRLLESFLAFRVPDKAGELFQKMEAVDHDHHTKTRILRFLHTYSHMDQIAEPDHDLSALSETPAIMKDVLDLIQGVDKDHYQSMVKLVAQAPEAS